MIWFAGDLHGRFEHIAKAIDAARAKPQAIILLGDMEAPTPLHACMHEVESRGVDWYWIIGNHDTDSHDSFANISDPISMAHDIDGRVVDVDGVRVAGLGGVFRGEIWYPRDDDRGPSFNSYDEYRRSSQEYLRLKARLSKRDVVQAQAVPPESHQWEAQLLELSRGGKLLKHRSTIFPDVYERLMSSRADILVTHEAPSCHPHGFRAIDRLAKAMGVQAIFHGHHHDSQDYTSAFELMGFKSYGVGFRGITDIDGHAIRTGAP
jgi:predicted phosphodiesterase